MRMVLRRKRTRWWQRYNCTVVFSVIMRIYMSEISSNVKGIERTIVYNRTSHDQLLEGELD